VQLRDGENVSARYLLTATGFLSQPNSPDIAGIESFAGKVIHTADWDDDYDLHGKRAAVIGTGATAVQLIPEIAGVLDELTVYQRTPIWVTPKLDGDIPNAVQRVFARLPITQRAARLANSSLLEVLMVTAVLHFRQAQVLNRAAARMAKRHLHRQIRDPELRSKLTPDYDFGCKRPTFSNTYYPTFNRPNVHLETTPIDHVEPDGIVTSDGVKTELDTLILATGFNIWDTNFPALEIIGRDGRNLGKWWRENRFQAYEGVAIPSFPNYLSLASPYSYSGLSYFTTIESQMRHIKRLFTELERRGASTFEVSEEANAVFLQRMRRKLGDSVFALGSCSTARSYYFNQHGEAAILRPTSTINAFREADRFPLDDYAYA
jgi:cation diffusion facilitator CzcD-associated flavoprotein CzcO